MVRRKPPLKVTESVPIDSLRLSSHSLDMALNHHGEDSSAPFVFEPTEIDYLKEIVLAYMTGTDRIVRIQQFNTGENLSSRRRWRK
jgi:hypothetical protein